MTNWPQLMRTQDQGIVNAYMRPPWKDHTCLLIAPGAMNTFSVVPVDDYKLLSTLLVSKGTVVRGDKESLFALIDETYPELKLHSEG